MNFESSIATLSSERPLRILRIGLGLFWISGEMMQLQPGIFHPAFYGNLPSSVMPSVLEYIHQRDPNWIAWSVSVTQSLFIRWPIETNLFIILVQLGLAASLLIHLPTKYLRLGLWGSVTWGILIWVFIQSLGGAQSWGYGLTFYDGFPGSALLYACTAAILLLSFYGWPIEKLGKLTTRFMAIMFWICGIFQITPFNLQWTAGSQLHVFANSGFQYQPQLIGAPIMSYSTWVSSHPILNNIVLSGLLFAAGICAWFWTRSSLARFYFYCWLFWSWWFGMNFGYIFSGLCTDLSTPPILFVMLFAFRFPSIRPFNKSTVKKPSLSVR